MLTDALKPQPMVASVLGWRPVKSRTWRPSVRVSVAPILVVWALCSLASALPAHVAADDRGLAAQQEATAQETPVQEATAQGTAARVATPQQVSAQEATPRTLEIGAQLFAPIYPGSDALDLGLGARGRVAWHLPFGLRPEIEVGYSRQGVADQRESLGLLQLGAGARYALPRFGHLEPLVGAGLTLNYWSRSIVPGEEAMSTTPMNPFGFTQEPDDTIWTPGFWGLAGVAMSVQPWLLVDVGVRVDYSFNRDVFASDSRRVFEHSQLYWSPWLGVSFFH